MIEVQNLTKRYGDTLAVDDISFTCKPGSVTGFLGPNGAGKSTTLRMLTGLTPATSGRATIGGHAYRAIPNPGTQVGVLLDASAQHSGRTGREVLTIAAKTMGLPDSRVDEMLAVVGLSPKEARRRVGNYSLGMRQRLGVAQSLLSDPQVLILDEPANGLDPAGIHWMRQLLRMYADRGGTVLLSSHLLHEIEVIADELIVIGRGRIVAQGTKDDLLAGAGTFVRALEPDLLASALASSGIHVTPATTDGFHTDAEPADVGKAAAAAGIALVELRPGDRAGLEDLFLQLTSDDQRDDLVHGVQNAPKGVQA
ncbi:ABC-2 type transport system ATP-binding protein [Mumia flava]|uniref:ABC-2 type transport system ATP-binding protein n=1 Tax=Mumia flava TaxID=1348852 RepID=A0A0B2BL54_9ACTN|nr:ATP-binding cassette domain-containing protein [Mumia flava]PJJ56292.1 ABC-2 type transport system ATP-binding protein [Mumia flava]